MNYIIFAQVKNAKTKPSFNPFSQVNELHRVTGLFCAHGKGVLIPSVRSMNYIYVWCLESDSGLWVLIPSVRSMNYIVVNPPVVPLMSRQF